MKTSFPYVYTETYAWNGGSGTRSVDRVAWVTADVSEVTRNDLVDFARWMDYGGPTDDIERVCTIHEGRIYQQVLDWDDNPVSSLPSTSEERLDREAAYQMLDLHDMDERRQERIEAVLSDAANHQVAAPPSWASRPTDSDQAVEEARMKAHLERLLLVDGEVWQRTLAPVIRCEQDRMFIVAHNDASQFASLCRSERASTAWFVGLSELDVIGNLPGCRDAKALYDDLRVFGEEDDAFLGREEILARTMELLVTSLDVSGLPADAAEDWVVMRDATRTYYARGMVGKVADGAEDALRRFAERAMPDRLHARLGEALELVNDYSIAAAMALPSSRLATTIRPSMIG